MAGTAIPSSLRDWVRRRADYRCEYCQSSEWLTGQRGHIDHIVPESRGGETTADNLCLACAACNSAKLDRVEAIDPESGMMTPLFSPRRQNWEEHFAWDKSEVQIVGLSPCGRATVAALKLNRPLVIAARAVWVSVGRHPPAK
ncbi:MAG: HNH endonuclease [Caldilineales bacterium]|nr:HNH endonuclease [Caldilineales bacterium]